MVRRFKKGDTNLEEKLRLGRSAVEYKGGGGLFEIVEQVQVLAHCRHNLVLQKSLSIDTSMKLTLRLTDAEILEIWNSL